MRSEKVSISQQSFLTAHFDHGDGDVRAWQAGDECLVSGYVGEREIGNRVALELVGLRTARVSKLDVNEVSDGAIEDELLHHKVDEQYDFATRTQSVVHGERIFLDETVARMAENQSSIDIGNGSGEGVNEVMNNDAVRLCPRGREMDGIFELGSLFCFQTLETAREEKAHVIIVHLTIPRVRQESQHVWVVLPANVVHVDAGRAVGRAILFVRRIDKVGEGNTANGFRRTKFGRPWVKHSFDVDGQ